MSEVQTQVPDIFEKTPDILAIMAAVPDLQARVEELEIRDDETDLQAKTFIAQITGHIKSAEIEYRRFKDPIVKRGRELDDAYKSLTRPLKALKDTLGDKVYQYSEQRAREARAEAERLRREAEEAERQQREAEATAEKERLAAEALLENAATDEDIKVATELLTSAEQKVTDAAQIPVAIPMPEVRMPERTTRTAAGVVTVSGKLDVEVVSPELVPREYCEPSLPKLRAAIKLGTGNIPGCRIYAKATTTTRSSS